MEFDGFSSDDGSESDSLPPPLPPDPDSSTLDGTVAVEPVSAALNLGEKCPCDEVKSRGGAIGGGRTPLLLPKGCRAFLTETGLENFTCICQVIFTEKKNLLRHFQDCETRTTTVHPTKRRKLGSSISESESPKLNEEHQEFEEDDTSSTSAFYFIEDEEGTQLLQCK